MSKSPENEVMSENYTSIILETKLFKWLLKSRFVHNNSQEKVSTWKGSSPKIQGPLKFFCENTYYQRSVFSVCTFNFFNKNKSCPGSSLLTVKIEIWRDCFRREQTNESFIQGHSAKVFFFYVQYWMVYLLAPPLV